MREAEIAVVNHVATAEQRRRVEAMAHERTRAAAAGCGWRSTGRADPPRPTSGPVHHDRMASTKDWFETVAEAQRRAKKRLPRSVYLALVAGTEKGLTSRDNVAAFDELGFRPHVADLPRKRELATTVMGQDVSLPRAHLAHRRPGRAPGRRGGRGPRRRRRGHRDGPELVRQQADRGGRPPPTRRSSSRCTGRATATGSWPAPSGPGTAGAKGLIVTLDWSFATRRDWGAPPIPEKIDVKNAAEVRARGAAQAGLARDLPAHRLDPRPDRAQHGAPRGGGPRLLRRLLRVDADPAAALGGHRLAAGAVGRAVHGQGHHPARRRPPGGGRRRLGDLGVHARRQQPRRHAGGDPLAARRRRRRRDQIEVLLDGGIRRGSDVVKAMALGAKAVMIGRAYLWGMAANGERGVSNVLSILRSGMDEALLGLGRSSVHELSREDVLVPPGFTRDWA